jgi:hypothetical protein
MKPEMGELAYLLLVNLVLLAPPHTGHLLVGRKGGGEGRGDERGKKG